MKPINHETVRHLIGEGMNITRNSELCKAVRSHLAECGECHSYLDSVEKTIDCYRSYSVELSEEAKTLVEETFQLLERPPK